MSILYMIPCPIGETSTAQVLPAANLEIIRSLDYFVVENLRSARRFLSAAGIGKPIDSLRFAELNEHTPAQDIEKLVSPLLQGINAGMISEAGVPGVADPGAELAAACHRRGIRVVPLVGPSSILLALMASGQCGQSFAFNGYLPIKDPDRGKAIRHFERRALLEGQSQIFIEAPYRNAKLFSELLSTLATATRLTIAADILSPEEFIRTSAIADWRRSPVPEINKRPAIFIIGR
jgi:16S rRNA (cytidine1402-2'-O)-methyltransferase